MQKMKQSISAFLLALLLTACGSTPTEKKVTAENASISGNSKNYIKVVDGNYNFTNDGDDAFITVQFELKQKPESEICRSKYPESIKLNPIGENGTIFDTGSYGFTLSRSEMGKLKDLINTGAVNDKVRVSFKWDYFGVSDEKGKPIFEKSSTFEIIDNTFDICDNLSNKKVHWEDRDVEIKKTNDNVSSKSTESKKSNSDNKEWDKALDSYEDYIDQYAKLLKKVKNGDASAMTEYPEMMEKATDFSKKLENAGNDLSTKQMTRFMKLQTKFAEAMQNLN